MGHGLKDGAGGGELQHPAEPALIHLLLNANGEVDGVLHRAVG